MNYKKIAAIKKLPSISPGHQSPSFCLIISWKKNLKFAFLNALGFSPSHPSCKSSIQPPLYGYCLEPYFSTKYSLSSACDQWVKQSVCRAGLFYRALDSHRHLWRQFSSRHCNKAASHPTLKGNTQPLPPPPPSAALHGKLDPEKLTSSRTKAISTYYKSKSLQFLSISEAPSRGYELEPSGPYHVWLLLWEGKTDRH